MMGVEGWRYGGVWEDCAERVTHVCLARYLATLYEERQRWIFYVPVPSEHETSGILGPDLNRPRRDAMLTIL